jgi:hypothetical protein
VLCVCVFVRSFEQYTYSYNSKHVLTRSFRQNLYGEKQWLLIADRYLPDRSINIISQRYSKLSLMLYQAHGIKIDENGDLDVPPKVESVDKVDEAALATLKKVDPPAILNVHRWSIEEDLTLLRAVPVLGHMWAELSTRLIPHRDRGHLRKRYQVLERRVKATVMRAQKEQPRAKKPPTPAPQFLKKRGKTDLMEHTSMRLSSSPIKPLRKPGHLLPASSPNHEEDGQFQDPEDSRLGFERMLQDNDWSHMSRVKHIMETEPPNSSLSGVNHLASAAAAAAAMERMGNNNSNNSAMERIGSNNSNHSAMERMANNSNHSSGLAMLADNVRESPLKIRRSILDSVLDRTGGPRKNEESPETPSRRLRPSTVMSSPASRIGYSPAFKGGISPAPLFKSPGAMGSPAPLFKSPGGGMGSMPAFKLLGGMGSMPALWGRDDSLQAAGDCVADPAYAFEISERSRQAFGVPSTPSKLGCYSSTGLTPTANSNSGFGGHEMDVVKALNELSNSPARFNLKPKAKIGDETKNDSVKRSLFDTVVKGADRNSKKRKY